ncbi:MAG: glycosyltransferase [Gemmatimonadota bacterium]|nr:glycosyltransferase [Gemmatimonadota bacterium]
MPPASPLPSSRVTTISVLVPSWRRPDDLARCLRALAAQRVPPFEVVVGARADDAATAGVVAAEAARRAYPVALATTSEPGVIAAMAAALTRVRGDIVALTDDDTEPRPDWIEKLDACFLHPRVGGVGGRDWQPTERGDHHDVGRVQWFGRVIGHHHLGAGAARPVDVLKGANAAFRTSLVKAVGFDARLRGTGAQMFWELALCLPLRRAGWTLIYDPAIAVDHHIAPRHDADQRHRGTFSAGPQVDAVHNETLVLLEHLGDDRRAAFLCWAFLVGTRIEPGLLQGLRLVLRGERDVAAKVRATWAGRRAGWRAWRAGATSAPGRAASVPAPPRA